MKNNKLTITTKNTDGKDLKLVLVKPDGKIKSEARKQQAKEFSLAVSEHAPLRSVLMDYMRDQGLWNDEKEAELREVSEKLREGERQFARGGKTVDGKRFSKADARELALNMREWRLQYLVLMTTQFSMDAYTVEGRADNAYFDYLVSVCSKHTNGKPVFSSYDDYVAKADEDYASELARNLRDLLHGEQEDVTQSYGEEKFLKKYKFVDEDGGLVDDKGRLVSEDGRLIDKDGRLLDEEGNFIDVDGNRVDEDGNPVEDFVEYED